MQLNDTLARQIVSRAMKILSFSVNVMDEHGLIIASGNPERLHQRHEGAVLALTENRVVEISEATARQLKGVRPGINLPIAYQGELLGVIGISGDPEEVRAYAELVRMTAELILEQAALTEQLQWDKRHKEELVLQLIRGEGRVDQLQQAPVHECYLPYASSPGLLAILETLQAEPGNNQPLAHWALQVHVSERTLARQFVRELGMSFGEWRQRLRYLAAIEALETSRSVQEIAFDLGYSSGSAFIAMFARQAGCTPEQYRRSHLEGRKV